MDIPHNNFFENPQPQSEEYIPIENGIKEMVKCQNEKITSMNEIRPNTADMDYKIVFQQRGHRMFNKGMKIFTPNKEEKKENPISWKQTPLKRAGTSNALVRRRSNTKKLSEGITKLEFHNTNKQGFQMNLFEKYQNFLVFFF